MSPKAKSAKRVRKQVAAPVMRARQAPRGKPFPKGHSIGLSTRFQPGQSGNPGGRPVSRKLSEAYRAIAASDLSDPIPVRTEAEAVARKVFKMARKGNMSAAREIADRIEGRPAVTLQGGDGHNNLALLIASMDRASDLLGPPEGMPCKQPLLEAGDDEIEEQES